MHEGESLKCTLCSSLCKEFRQNYMSNKSSKLHYFKIPVCTWAINHPSGITSRFRYVHEQQIIQVALLQNFCMYSFSFFTNIFYKHPLLNVLSLKLLKQILNEFKNKFFSMHISGTSTKGKLMLNKYVRRKNLAGTGRVKGCHAHISLILTGPS